MAAEAEAGETDQGVHVVETERSAGDESDLGVERFDEGVGQAVLQGRGDGCPVVPDPLGES